MSGAVVMIHGRGPKPDRDTLQACWASFLPTKAKNLPLDMVLWVDLFGYTPPVQSGPATDCAHIAAADLPDATAQAIITALPDQTLENLQRQLTGSAWSLADLLAVKDKAVELLWDQFVAVSQNQFAIDVRTFFQNPTSPLRVDSRARLKAAILQARAAGHEVLVLAHSFGTIVAYEVARELHSREIHTLVTMGSPLAWCYDMWGPAKPPLVAEYLQSKEFPRLGLRGWWNVYDPTDPVATARVVAIAPQLGPDYLSSGLPTVIDCPIKNTYANPGDLGSPHDYRGYLTSEPVQRAIQLFLFQAANP